MSRPALANAAERLVGTPFRLHGRDPATGLDCIGVLAAALTAIGRMPVLPDTYTLRTQMPVALEIIADANGLAPATLPLCAGDVLLTQVSAFQLHLLVALAPARFVHAHAGLRRVVVLDAPLPWSTAAHWRLGQPN